MYSYVHEPTDRRRLAWLPQINQEAWLSVR